MQRAITLVAVGALALMALSGCTTKIVTTEGAAPLYTVTAGGTGKVLAPPDEAELYFGASALESDAKVALDTASKAADRIISAVKGAGVATDDVQTSNVSVFPEYSYGDEGKAPEVTAYRANVQVRVKVRDIEKIGAIIGAASDAGATDIGGPSFMLSDDSDLRNEAIEGAIADARKRAGVMAKAAGKSLGEIISVSETGISIPPIIYERAAAAYDTAEAVPIEPGQLEISAGVTVVFELK